MTDRKYPRIGRRDERYTTRRGGISGKPCKICEKPGVDTIVTVQVNWFRGDDDSAFVHKGCIKNKREDELLVLLGYAP